MKIPQNRLIGFVHVILLALLGTGMSSVVGQSASTYDLNPRCENIEASLDRELSSIDGATKFVRGKLELECTVDYVPQGLSWDIDVRLKGPQRTKKEGDIIVIRDTKLDYSETIVDYFVPGIWTLSFSVRIVDEHGKEIHAVASGSISALF